MFANNHSQLKRYNVLCVFTADLYLKLLYHTKTTLSKVVIMGSEAFNFRLIIRFS